MPIPKEELADKIYDILVEHAGARPEPHYREYFKREFFLAPLDRDRHWRGLNKLGPRSRFFLQRNGSMWVEMEKHLLNAELIARIQKINQLLKETYEPEQTQSATQ